MEIKIRELGTNYGMSKRQVCFEGEDTWYDIPENGKQAQKAIANLRMMKYAPVMYSYLNNLKL